MNNNEDLSAWRQELKASLEAIRQRRQPTNSSQENKTMTLEEITESQDSILDRCVLLSLSIHKFGITKKVKSTEVQSDASPEMIKVSKRIIDSDAYDEISKRDGEFTRLLTELALPSMFRAGVYAIPLALLDRIDAEIHKFENDREPLIDKFIEMYESEMREAEILLGSLFDAQNYPAKENVRGSFYLDYKYVSTSVPEKLRQIRPDIFEREGEKARQEILSMRDNIMGVLRASVRDLISHAADKLAPKADGTQQIFRDSLIGNIRDFLETFEARNLAKDEELSEICQQVDGLLAGVTPDALRNDGELRQEIRQNFEAFTKTLDTMIVDRPKRRIRTIEPQPTV